MPQSRFVWTNDYLRPKKVVITLLGCGAAVAQRTVNPLVVGSNPTTPASGHWVHTDHIGWLFGSSRLTGAGTIMHNIYKLAKVFCSRYDT